MGFFQHQSEILQILTLSDEFSFWFNFCDLKNEKPGSLVEAPQIFNIILVSTGGQEVRGGSTLTFKHYSKHSRLGQEQAEHMFALRRQAWNLPAQPKPSR